MHRVEEYDENEFVVARFAMTCCTAYMQIVGLLCRFDDVYTWETDTWIEVKGFLAEGEYRGHKVSFIVPVSVMEAERPFIEYVYP